MPEMHTAYEQAGLFAKQCLRWVSTPVTLVRPHLVKRRIRVYGVGLGKSGTHSLAGLFRQYRAAHEPESDVLIPILIQQWDGWTQAQRASYVHQRDRRLWLEVEASHVIHELIETFIAEFPDAKFVLTMRDVYSWIESQAGHNLSHPTPARWMALAYHRMPLTNRQHSLHAQVLADYNLRPLEELLTRWARHHHHILNIIPGERLLVLRTVDLARSGAALASFLNIPEKTLDMSQAHLYRSTRKAGMLSKVDQGFLQSKVAEYCGDLMNMYYPEIRGLDDALAFETSASSLKGDEP